MILRGLKVTAVTPLETNGINIEAATAVTTEDCVIENLQQKGILDARTAGNTWPRGCANWVG